MDEKTNDFSLYNDNRLLYMTDGVSHGCESGTLTSSADGRDGKIQDHLRQVRKCSDCDMVDCTFKLLIDGRNQNRYNINNKTSLTQGKFTGIKEENKREDTRFYCITVVPTRVPELQPVIEQLSAATT